MVNKAPIPSIKMRKGPLTKDLNFAKLIAKWQKMGDGSSVAIVLYYSCGKIMNLARRAPFHHKKYSKTSRSNRKRSRLASTSSNFEELIWNP
jgi:hypothetical protein